jgi:transposase/putative transposase
MLKKRKSYSGAMKAKVGLEAMLGMKTTAQIARDYQVHPMLVGQWKTIIRERVPELFERGRQLPEDSERLIAQLHQKIGQLTVDLDWLKKKSKQLGLSLNDER